jgi:hypothetical protein
MPRVLDTGPDAGWHVLMTPKQRIKNQDLQSKYGITLLEYERMYVRQHGCCRVCGDAMVRKSHTARSCVVDHNHRTGEVRGLLCHGCNAGLGAFRERIDALENAIAYLRSQGSIHTNDG